MQTDQIQPLALEVAQKLRAAGHQAYLVGGCVRDLLLGLRPKDFDVATEARPEQLMQLFPRATLVGRQFGVLLVTGEAEGGAAPPPIEVATFRRDGIYKDGRRPEDVAFVDTPEADARRRDFTMNGLYFDPLEGRLLDFVGGEADLLAGLIRAIGNPGDRFAEDHLRMLRAVRFAARFGFIIAEETAVAIRANAASIQQIAAERIRDELTGIFTQGGAETGLRLLHELELLPHLFPEALALQGVQQPPDYHPEGDVWTHVLQMLRHMGPATPTLAWGVLLHDICKPETFTNDGRIRFLGHDRLGAEKAREILGRLRYPTATIEQVSRLVADHMRFKDLPNMRPSTQKRFLRQEHFEELLALHRLDLLGSTGNLASYEAALELYSSLRPEELRPTPLLKGQDLLAVGVLPGPRMGYWLDQVEEAMLNGELTEKQQALDWLVAQPGFPA